MKAPTADNLKAVKRNLKRERWQSERIIFDCRRVKRVPDTAIEREVRKRAFAVPRNSLLFVGTDRTAFPYNRLRSKRR